jgi:phage gp46-like protein
MADILLNKTKDYWDVGFAANGDFDLTRGLETAVLMSILVDKRAAANEVPRVELRRGWHGNKLSGYDNYEIGSKLWLLFQSRNDRTILGLINTYVSDCLSWMVTDNIATKIITDSSFIPDGIQINVTIYRSQNIIFSNSYILWENTNLLSIQGAT